MRPTLFSLWAVVITTWSSTALAQGAPAPPATAPPAAPMTVPGGAPATGPAPAARTAPAAAPPPGDGRFVLGPAPAPAPAPVAVYPAAQYATPRPASPPYDPYIRRPLVVEGHTAIGGPVGWLGVGVDYSVARYVSIMGGAGIGQAGPQLASMLRLRLPLDTVSAGFGAGVSAGEYEDGILDTNERYRWDTAYWLNTEGFIEIRTRKGINIRPYMGSGALLNVKDGKPLTTDTYCVTIQGKPPSCTEISPSRDRIPFLFYMGVAIGYAFEL